MNTEQVSLVPFHEELIPQAREKWKRSYGLYTRNPHIKIPTSFNKFLDAFKDFSVGHAALAKKLGVTKECIRQIYNKFFRDIFGGKSRQEIVDLTKIPIQARRLVKVQKKKKELLEKSNLNNVVNRAKASGCDIDLLPKTTKGWQKNQIHTKRLLINGHLCLVRHLNASQHSPESKRSYGRTTLNRQVLEEVSFIIFEVEITSGRKLVFVVPNTTLLEIYFDNQARKENVSIYLPSKHHPIYHNITPRLSWWSHEEAWHLIPSPPAS